MLLLATIPSTHADLESQACSNLTTGATDASGRAGAGNDQARSAACSAGHLESNASTQDAIMSAAYGVVATACYIACAYNQTAVCTGALTGINLLDSLVLSKILERQNAESTRTLVATTQTGTGLVSAGIALAQLGGGASAGSTMGKFLCYAQAGIATVTMFSKIATSVMNADGAKENFKNAQTLLGNRGALLVTPEIYHDGSSPVRGEGTTTSAISGGARDARGNANPTVQPTGDGSVDHSQDLQIGTCLSNPGGGSGCSAVSAAMNSKDWPKGIDHPDFKKFTKDKFGKTPGELASTMYAQRDNPAGAIASAVEGVPGLSGSTKGAIGQVIGFHKSLYGELKGELASGYSRGSTASSGSPEDPNAQLQEALAGFAGQLGGGRPKKQNPASGNELAFRGASAPERAIAAEDRTVGIFDRIHWRYERANLSHP